MRTRPDAHQQTLARRLALLQADVPAEEWDDEEDADPGWWGARTSVRDEVVEPPPAVPPAQTPAQTPAPVLVSMPIPGRHASRRSIAFTPQLPETLRGRVRLGAAQLAVVALVLVVALLVTCWWLARGRASVLASPTPTGASASASAAPLVTLPSPGTATAPAAAPAASSAAGAAPAASPGGLVTVDVEGKVGRPGIVAVPAGSRVTDALKAAGGVSRRRALGGLNLAAVLVDGQQIVVGAGASGAGTSGGVNGAADPAAAGTATSDAPVNLNTATAEQLDTLPGVGPVTAQSILEWREQNGGFTSVQELLEVDGIGPATLAKLTPHVTL
ncbi:helix-hairpin-helix domain-containing protein [Nocardioides sp. Iso805N]|uniref:helix-hairpin-helix domain-containing protein n=1 Tax=Nocardioides sp. Iso805N TaxID=1283287 RepID=UPI0003790925|nr:helix-hairpin-helix domain-containing protein [Nocardioides sp. Iso805N]